MALSGRRGGTPAPLTVVRLADVPAATFAAWLELMRAERGWSLAEAARRLGCCENSVARWRDRGAPAHVGLACHALARGIGQWRA